MNTTRYLARFLRPSSLAWTPKYNTALRSNPNGSKPGQEEDIYEKLCREEKEKIKQRDEASAKEQGMKSMPLKLITYGCLIVANYYLLQGVYEYIKHVNDTGDKTSNNK